MIKILRFKIVQLVWSDVWCSNVLSCNVACRWYVGGVVYWLDLYLYLLRLYLTFISLLFFHFPFFPSCLFSFLPISGQRIFLFHKKLYTFKDFHPVRVKQECSITKTILRKWNTYSNLIKSAGSEIKIIHEVTALS